MPGSGAAELDAAGVTDPALREAYATCRALNAAHGRTYFLATRLLPAGRRPAVHALYGFARYADEIVDDLDDDGAPLKGLSGTIVLLRDGGYDDPDILRWLFADDPAMPGCPITSLRAGRHREVKRRAQVMAF